MLVIKFSIQLSLYGVRVLFVWPLVIEAITLSAIVMSKKV